MAVIYKIELNLGLIYYAAAGLCTSGDLLGLERTAWKDPQRTTEMKVILDLRRAELDVNLDDMRALVDTSRQRIKEGFNPEMTAILSTNPFVNTLDSILHLLGDTIPLKTGVFNQLKDALIWLELSACEDDVRAISESLIAELQKFT